MQLRKIDFDRVLAVAKEFSAYLRSNANLIAESLSEFECYSVALDEIERSRELLENLEINREYFQYAVGGVTSFLPLNQPLYATTCFGVVPSLMAADVCLRPPTAMHSHYRRLWEAGAFQRFFPNLTVSYAEKESFIAQRAQKSDAVIFTGTPENANKVRRHFLRRCLFILNGAGHNPLVISENTDLDLAIESALRVVLYNQGQDCAGPNSILVSQTLAEDFCTKLLSRLQSIETQVGPYRDRSNIVGPNSDPDHPLKISNVFREHRQYCIYGGDVNPVSGLIRPAAFLKPLTAGGNYSEFFAPVFFIQPYASDEQLCAYFDDPRYSANAMYISLFGISTYVQSLIDRGLHDEASILRNTDLHLYEKGYMPYGGRGPSASCLYVNGDRICGATLPQRDLYEHLVKPKVGSVRSKNAEEIEVSSWSQ